jgi:hypothetical protein
VSTTLAEEAWALAFGGLDEAAGFALREAERHGLFRGEPDRFAGLLAIADLDRFLRTDAARTPRVAMADSARTGSAAVPEEEYAREDGRIELALLFARFDAGATLVVSQFHEHHEPLARFCRGLEQAFLHPVQANIYLTPPGAQGFRPHYDTHDVLVLQIAGEKAWRVWPGQPFPRPTRRTPWKGGLAPEGAPENILLRAGDALYVPRGVIHDAATQGAGEPSLHATIGLLEPSWAEAFRMAADLLERAEPPLRAAFPTWRLAEPARLAQAAAPLAAQLATPAALERLAIAWLDRLDAERAPMPARGLARPRPQPGETWRIADGPLHQLLPDGEGALLRHAGGVRRLDAREAAWLAALAEGARVEALGEGASAFVEELAALGLLERVSPPCG